jgi:hypothetical protein
LTLACLKKQAPATSVRRGSLIRQDANVALLLLSPHYQPLFLTCSRRMSIWRFLERKAAFLAMRQRIGRNSVAHFAKIGEANGAVKTINDSVTVLITAINF